MGIALTLSRMPQTDKPGGILMESFHFIDLTPPGKPHGKEILREMRAAVGRAKRTAGGERYLTGAALGWHGERLLFTFRLGKK